MSREVAAFAAGAEAHLTNEIAVCAGSCGAGNLHLMPRILAIAMCTAIAKRGVAVVVIPGDIALRQCSLPAVSLGIMESSSVVRPSQNELQNAADILNDAKKVTILGGAGCEGAHDELMAVARRLKAPIVHAMRGKEFIEYDNPFDVGMTGLLEYSSGYHAMMNCDALLMLGTDFPYQQFYPKEAKIIQVDVRGEQIGRRTPVDLGLIGKVNDTLEALVPLLEDKNDNSYLEKCLSNYEQARQGPDDLAVGEPGRTPIHPQYVAKVIDELASEDAVFTCDVGTPTVWAARYLHMNGRRRLLGSLIHGSMAMLCRRPSARRPHTRVAR
jgi:pyruvate dehydrogenase (quinone)